MAISRPNIVLIGMPGAGKSTVGVILAKKTAREFVDSDVVIQSSQGRTLQEIVDADGYIALRRIEEQVLLSLSLHNHVIATGGSAVYSDSAMNHLRSNGTVVFLDVDLPALESRVRDFSTRGLAKRPDHSFADLFYERLVLYRKHADVTINGAGADQETVCANIIRELTGKC